jgi:2-polyprenyl-3-methyl-5-hydroxy-6-metoxy-1,4-benzoquinol methylase
MSGAIVEKFWHLGNYKYVFYRFMLEQFCQQGFKKQCLMLDAGCGPKVCSLSYVPKNVFSVAIDVSRLNIIESHRKVEDDCRKKFNFIVASIDSLPFRQETFDLVVCVDVLEHMKTKKKAINEISQSCKTGAWFIGSTSNLLNPIMMFDSLLPRRVAKILTQRLAGEHYERHSRFSSAKLARLLNHANFQICSLELLGFPFFRPNLYEFSSRNPPWYAHLWIIFDRLTRRKPLSFLKETIIFCATKNGARY